MIETLSYDEDNEKLLNQYFLKWGMRLLACMQVMDQLKQIIRIEEKGVIGWKHQLLDNGHTLVLVVWLDTRTFSHRFHSSMCSDYIVIFQRGAPSYSSFKTSEGIVNMILIGKLWPKSLATVHGSFQVKSVLLIGPISNQVIHHSAIPINRQPQSLGASLWPSIPINLEIGPMIVAALRIISIITPAIKQCRIKLRGANIIPVNEAIDWRLVD